MQPAAWMTDPPWFLVVGLPWPGDADGAEMAESALAIAPAVTQTVRPAGTDGQPIPLGPDLALMLDAGSRCAAALGKRVLFVSDITRWLADTSRRTAPWNSARATVASRSALIIRRRACRALASSASSILPM